MTKNLQSSEENCFSPILPKQKMKSAKEERAEKIKVREMCDLTD
jgi:hypothetical protein